MNKIIIIMLIILAIALWYRFFGNKFLNLNHKLNHKMRDMHIKQIKKIIEEFNIKKRELY